LFAVLSTQDGATSVLEEIQAIEANAVVNPIYGDFSATRFVDSVSSLAALQEDSGSGLLDIDYLVFKDVTGFDLASQRGWMVDEGAQQVA